MTATISIATLLLGLISGPRPVAWTATGPIDRVVVELDGAAVASLPVRRGSAIVDFGPPAPHRLDLVALHADGREIARASQWVNMPKGAAEVHFVVEEGDAALPSVVRLVAASTWPGEIEELEVTLDGGPVDVGPEGRIELPAYGREEVHLLVARMGFSSGATATAEMAFGGLFGDRSAAELTAVPLQTIGSAAISSSRADLPLSILGEPATIAAVDRSGGEVVVVRDQRSQKELAELVRAVSARYLRTHLRSPRDLLPLPDEVRVRFLWPVATTGTARDRPRPIFARTAPVRADRKGLFALLGSIERPPTPQPIADAVGVAGLLAASTGRPRAVVLVHDPATPDASEHGPCAVRAFLAKLRVPLIVWTLGRAEAIDPGWGDVAGIATWSDLQRNVRRVRELLESQTIVWVEGSWLPGEVTLEPTTDRSTLVGAASDLAPECPSL